MSNLIDNALRYTPRGSTVTVGVHARHGRTNWWWKTTAPASAKTT
jgi:signal transduction histidine kinase